MPIDLRSDTVTRPTPAMLTAMAGAETGDDVYGEDPTIHALEERVAAMLGKEAGLFTVTGSLANQLGVRLHVEPGQELLCEERSHVVRAEAGAHAVLHGVTTRTWAHERGYVDLDAVRRLLAPEPGPYLVGTGAVAVENTHNFAGGTVQPLADLKALYDLVIGTPVKLHLDGARLWNAHVATGISLEAYGSFFDTVSVCLSKGLGAPVGSALAGSRELIESARRWRKVLGGGMRQSGIIAAACHFALEHQVADLAHDHRRAVRLAEGLRALPALGVEYQATNMVFLQVPEAHLAPLQAWLAERDILVEVLYATRLVVHRDLDDDAIERVLEAFTDYFTTRTI